MDLSVVIPVCNEAGNVAALCEELSAALARIEHEVIFVDDGSRDGTCVRLMKLRRGMPALRLLRHSENAGQSAALLTGVRAARAPWVATLDGDGQNDPADLPRLWTMARNGPAQAALYIGHRTCRHDSAWRLLSSRIANGVRSRVLGDGVPDTGCGIKLVRREVFLALPYFDHIHRFIPALVRREGWDVVSVPVSHRARRAGASKYGTLDRLLAGLVDMAGVLWLLRRRRRTAVLDDGAFHGR